MAKTKTVYRQSKKKGISGNTALLVGGGLLGLYLITRPGQAGPGTTPGPSILERITETVTPGPPGPPGPSLLDRIVTNTIVTPGANIISDIASVPAQIVIGIPKKMITASEERTSTEVFGGEKRTNVSAFLMTGSKKGDVLFSEGGGGVTYKQFIEQQPIAFRATAGLGNIITAQYAAQYGKYAAEETKKGISAAGRDPNAFMKESAYSQAFLTLGQAFTVPFGGGGAAGWGARFRSWIG